MELGASLRGFALQFGDQCGRGGQAYRLAELALQPPVRVLLHTKIVADSQNRVDELPMAFSHDGNTALPEALNALNKGAWVTVSGRLAYEEYETSEGEKRSDISIIVSKLEPLAEPGAEPKTEAAEAVAEGDFNPPEDAMPF